MINNTNIKVPKKYEHMIDEINHDSTGYWVNIEKGFYSPSTGCHTIHETSQKAVLEEIRKIQAETYDLKDENGTYIEENMTFEEAVERYKMTTRNQEMHSRQTGDRVEYLWDSQDLQRSDREFIDDLEDLSYKFGYASVDEDDMDKLMTEYDKKKELEQDAENTYIEHTIQELEEKRKWWLNDETV